MTKLGITAGVHGEDVQEKKDDDLTTVKVDPKVFTILQPIGAAPPVYTQPAPVREVRIITTNKFPLSRNRLPVNGLS